MAVICKRCIIAGKVQGVFYRASTYEQATKLGLNGWVRNLPDGRVESLVQGEAQVVEQMIDWFWQGSTFSQVISVQCYDEDTLDTDTFTVTR